MVDLHVSVWTLVTKMHYVGVLDLSLRYYVSIVRKILFSFPLFTV